ncbi:MAG: hypothetical protein PHW63_01305 [Alphaproteobacteria bacterium]|nr:hypothetical protein [Alphaproteobacteria bacterium]
MSLFKDKDQQRATRHKLWACAFLVCLLVGLSGCGKKPSFVDPPVSAKGESTYPRTYPAPDPVLDKDGGS